ncbi:hypothetical protein OCK74_20940 [Chitinophagaceae bacterium LB-8]|uniref:Uncharacterized protein n=1 Tax=Paraflavisolibacter caeni TaxID=2982496 RepID=A0A9X3B9P7_9BACT|nr:hypothetical protein [Paraflavisolibacter caeni]MCU7551601.1 hypothetical protein [Paraflavisolibacter caeni]
MNRNLLLSIAAIVLVVTAAIFISAGRIYSSTALMAIAIIAVMRNFRGMQVTRWAKANPRKTQVLITVLQIAIIFLGLLIGYNLKELGYQLSTTATVVFGTILCIGFFSIPFLPKRNTIALPVTLNRDRIAYLSIILSAFALMVITGNRIEDQFPNSPLSHTLSSIDQAIFSQDLPPADVPDLELASYSNQQQAASINENASMVSFASFAVTGHKSATIDPGKEEPGKIKPGKKAKRLERKKQRMMKQVLKLRKAFGAWATVGTIFLVLLLIVTTCSGICMIAIGGSAGTVAFGVVLIALSIFGIIKLVNRKKRIKPA